MLDGIRWVLFDAVGTLIYTDPPVAKAYRAVARRYGSRLKVEEIDERFRAALVAEQACGGPTSEANERERWQRLVANVIDDAPERREMMFEELWRHFASRHSWRLYADVRNTLGKLKRRGYRLGIASNFDGRLHAVVRAIPIFAKIRAIFVSSDIGFTKPDPRFFRGVEERLDIAPAQIALVGDDEVSDVQGATAAGWRAIGLNRSGTCTSPGTIHSLAELL